MQYERPASEPQLPLMQSLHHVTNDVFKQTCIHSMHPSMNAKKHTPFAWMGACRDYRMYAVNACKHGHLHMLCVEARPMIGRVYLTLASLQLQ